MFQWWQSFESVAVFNGWMHLIALVGAAATGVSALFLWINGNRMIQNIMEREQHAGNRIKTVEATAEKIRKELLETQQSQDIADQKRRLAEMDSDALRKEMEKIKRRYADAEGALKERINDLKDFNSTQGRDPAPTDDSKKIKLDLQQKKMLGNLLTSGPKGEIDIIAMMDTPESYGLASQFKDIFNEYGWTTKGIIQSAFSNPPDGILLMIHSKQTAPSYAKFLQRTLTTVGFPVQAQVNDKYQEWSISMIVGQFP